MQKAGINMALRPRQPQVIPETRNSSSDGTCAKKFRSPGHGNMIGKHRNEDVVSDEEQYDDEDDGFRSSDLR